MVRAEPTVSYLLAMLVRSGKIEGLDFGMREPASQERPHRPALRVHVGNATRRAHGNVAQQIHGRSHPVLLRRAAEAAPDRGEVVHPISSHPRWRIEHRPSPESEFRRAASLDRRLARRRVGGDRDGQVAGLIDAMSILSPDLV